MFFNHNSRKYVPVQDQEEGVIRDGQERKDLAPCEARTPTATAPATRQQKLIVYLWTLVFAGLAAFFFAENLYLGRRGDFRTGYRSDLVLATSAIRVSEVKFVGGIKFYDNGTMFRDHGPGKQYVGRPSPEIDAAWEDLIGIRYLAFTDHQKVSFQVDVDRSDEDGLYRAGPDVFHSLHDIDKL